MSAGKGLVRDWRNAAHYCALLDADRSFIAWEWLRRDPAYAEAVERACRKAPLDTASEAQRFGLVAFEDPALGVPDARPLWHSEVHAFVLRTRPAQNGCLEDGLDLNRFEPMVTLLSTPSCDHLLVSDGLRSIRLDGEAQLFAGGPVRLAYRLEGLGGVQAPLLTLRRLLSLNRSGRFSNSLHPREVRCWRWVQMLRTWDGLQEGASQRDIAGVLLSPSATRPDWRIRDPSLRSRAQRLVRLARTMGAGGYRALLA